MPMLGVLGFTIYCPQSLKYIMPFNNIFIDEHTVSYLYRISVVIPPSGDSSHITRRPDYSYSVLN